jgi:hypothetical protein
VSWAKCALAVSETRADHSPAHAVAAQAYAAAYCATSTAAIGGAGQHTRVARAAREIFQFLAFDVYDAEDHYLSGARLAPTLGSCG